LSDTVFPLKVAVNRRPFDFEEARRLGKREYAKRFTWGWESVEVSSWLELARIATACVWSPIVYKGEKRGTDAFVEARLVGLDFENPEYPLAQAQREWCDSVHMLGVTMNHGKDGLDRFRIVSVFRETISDARTYTHNLSRLIDHYGADVKAKDGARLFFPCTRIVSGSREGYQQDVEAAPPQREFVPSPLWREQRIVRPYTRYWLTRVIPEGERNDTVFRMAKELCDAGWDLASIYAEIVSSPTYGGQVSPKLSSEIHSTILSGIKSVMEGKAFG
jgi:hypothetical protein